MAAGDETVKTNSLTPTYIIAVISIIGATLLGALSIGTAIALFAGQAVDYPGLIGLALSYLDGLVAPVAVGLLAVAFGATSFVAFSKISKSTEAAGLASTPTYRVVTALGFWLPAFFGVVSGIYALAVCLATLLAIQDGLPWGAYYLGQFLPVLLVSGALIAAAFMVRAFSQAKLQAKIMSAVALSVAALGLILVFVAVGIKSHSDDAGALFNLSESTTKSLYDYFDF